MIVSEDLVRREAATADPWVISIRELGRRAGTMEDLERVVTLVEPLGTDILSVGAGEQVDLRLRLESVVEGVLVTGEVTAEAHGECVRCLKELDEPVDVRFQELFAYPDRAAHHREVGAPENEDTERVIEDDTVDLGPVVTDAVVPGLPFQPVCREDCPGLCPQCGARMELDPEHHHDVIDPRWSALAGLAQSSTEEVGDGDARSAADPSRRPNTPGGADTPTQTEKRT